VTVSTFAQSLDAAVRADPSRPLVTFYDDATGERVELSVVTYANWVSKTAGLLQDELDLDRGGLLLVDLPPHWLGAVWLGGAWTAGLAVTTDAALAGEADLVVCGPSGVDHYAASADERPVVALSLRPLGGRFVDALPRGVLDYSAVVLGQPDSFLAYDPPGADDVAWRGVDGVLTQSGLLSGAAADPATPVGGRLLTDVNPCSPTGVRALTSALSGGGGVVWVANPDPGSWERRYDEERATAQLRTALPS
jgi:uncharacterized protein (TIGR03089 family)